MMRVHRLLGALAVGALLQACGDDPESPPNRPPDLRMEDVVGCWTQEPAFGQCELQCFDPSGSQLYRKVDTIGVGEWAYEYVGSYSIDGWNINSNVIAKTTGGIRKFDSTSFSQGYLIENRQLVTVNQNLELGTRYTPVNLDSTLPCGTPFQLLPKPEGWTLF